MRYITQIFQPIITIPKNAKIKNTEITCKSQKLLLECGLVRPTSSGFFTLLPLARRALDKLENLVRKHIESVAAQRISLPALTSESLWEKSGRLTEIGPELVRVVDRHDKKYLLAPTHEESIADLLADVGPLSYKQLPFLLYQISNKYRDELRPKHGLLRAREFRMLDAYGAHAALDSAREEYARVSAAYRGLFDDLKLHVHRVKAPSGDMGGSTSHEWQLSAPAGEDAVNICLSCSHTALAGEVEGGQCEQCGGAVETVSSIEVGHTFILGERYSAPLQAHYTPARGSPQPLLMTCYGIGTTRLLAASVEALSSDTSLRWPRAIAPYNTVIIGPKEGSKEWVSHGVDKVQQLGERVQAWGDVIVDDRHSLTIGKRVMMADKMGYPNIIVCGKSALESPPRYELHRPVSGGGHDTSLVGVGELGDLLGGEDTTEVIENKL